MRWLDECHCHGPKLELLLARAESTTGLSDSVSKGSIGPDGVVLIRPLTDCFLEWRLESE